MLFDWYYLMPFAFTAFLKHFLQRVSHMQIHYKADQSKAELCVQGGWVSPGLVTVLLTGHSAVRLSWVEQSLTLLCQHAHTGQRPPPCKAQVTWQPRAIPSRQHHSGEDRVTEGLRKWGQRSTGITFTLPEENKLYAEQWDFLFIFHKENILCSSFLCNLKFCFLCQYTSPAARAFSS